jgi:O-antigen ligase
VLGLAALLVVGTGISLFAVSVNVDETFARQSIGVWVGGIVTPFAAMFVAAWLARRGDLGVLPVLVVAASVAGVMGLIDHLSKGAFDGTGLAWTIEEGIKGERRLSGVPGLPNAAATMLLAPTILLGTAALGLRDRRLRVAAALGSVVALGILALTFSRSAFLALVAVAIVVAWRRDRRVGMLVAAASIVLVLVLLPQIVGQRGDAGGDAGLVTSGDDDRVRSWTAAFRMWLDAPLTGHGFQSFRLLHGLFGEPEISAPHNEWLRFFAEEGVFLGIAGLALIGIGSLALARERGWLATGILGVFIGYVIMASFNNPLTYGQVGLMVFPVVGTGLGLALARRARRDPVLAPSPRVAGPAAPEAPNAPAGSPSRGSSEA